MAVETTVTFAYSVGNGVTVAFSLPFYFIDPAHIVITFDGVVQTGGFAISGTRDPAGGTVTFTSPPADGTVVGRRRVVPITQPVDTQNNQTIFEDVFDDAQDRRCMVEQQLAEQVGRAIQFPQGEETLTSILPAAADRAGGVIGFDELGNVDIFSTDAENAARAEAAADAAEAFAADVFNWTIPFKGFKTQAQLDALTPAVGDRWIVTDGTNALKGAEYFSTGWKYSPTPLAGQRAYIGATSVEYFVQNSAWTRLVTQPASPPRRIAFLDLFEETFFGRGMLTAETINITTEQFITANAAVGADTLAVFDSGDFEAGGQACVLHDNGLYDTYFLRQVSSNISLDPPLRYAVTANSAKVERSWFNPPHAGKFVMRHIAQRIALAKENAAPLAERNRLFYTAFDSGDIFGLMVPTGVGSVSYEAADSEGTTPENPPRFTLGRTAYIDITADGDGMETMRFDVVHPCDAICEISFTVASPVPVYLFQVFDDQDNPIAEERFYGGSGSRATQVRRLAFRTGAAKTLRVRLSANSNVSGATSIQVHKIDVYEAPRDLGYVIAKRDATIVCLGDSWAAGDPGNANRESFTVQLALELPLANIVNAGVGGNRIYQLLERFDDDVAPHSPDYVVIDCGVNDCYGPNSPGDLPASVAFFCWQYTLLLNKCYAIGARPIVLGVPALGQYDAETPLADWELNDRARVYVKGFLEYIAAPENAFTGMVATALTCLTSGTITLDTATDFNKIFTTLRDGICTVGARLSVTSVSSPLGRAQLLLPFAAADEVSLDVWGQGLTGAAEFKGRTTAGSKLLDIYRVNGGTVADDASAYFQASSGLNLGGSYRIAT